MNDEWLEADDDDVDPFTKVHDWVLDVPLSHGAFRTFVILRSYLRRGKRVAFPSRATLARRMGLSRPQSVDGYLDELIAADMIAKQTTSEPGPNGGTLQRSNRYLVATLRPLCAKPHRGSTENRTGVVLKTAHEADEEKQMKGSTTAADASEGLFEVESPIAKPKTKPKPGSDPVVEKLCDLLVEALAGNRVASRTDSTSRRVMSQVLALPGATPAEVEHVIGFATTDPFWRSQITSFADLRRKYDRVRLRMPTSGPAASPERPTAPNRDPGLDRYLSGSYGAQEAASLLLSRSISPARLHDEGRDQVALIRRALATAPTYPIGSDEHHELLLAWEFRGEGQTLRGAVPAWEPVRV